MKTIPFLICLVGFMHQINAQPFTENFSKKRIIDLQVKKIGPFLGIEKGRFFNVNLGGEYQKSYLRIVKPRTYAVNFQLDYNFKQNVLGAQIGTWYKQGRLGLTYGGRISWIHDLNTQHRFGISPTIGYKFLQAHMQFGIHLRTPNTNLENVNVFYASLRWVFVNSRKFDRK